MGWFRKPHTQSQKRRWDNQFDYIEEFPELRIDRPRRGPHGLCDSWDELHVASREECSWKNFRRTQYRVKAEPKVKEARPKIIWHTKERTFGVGGWYCGWGVVVHREYNEALHDAIHAYLNGDVPIDVVAKIDPVRANELRKRSYPYRVRTAYRRHHPDRVGKSEESKIECEIQIESPPGSKPSSPAGVIA